MNIREAGMVIAEAAGYPAEAAGYPAEALHSLIYENGKPQRFACLCR